MDDAGLGPDSLQQSNGSAPDDIYDEPKKEINVSAWLNRIGKARQKEQNWRERAKRCIRTYRDDGSYDGTYTNPRTTDSDNGSTFNILFANTDTLQPALFSRTPKPDVRNTYFKKDPISAEAGQAIERALTYFMDAYDFTGVGKAVVKDYLLTGRGVLRVRMDEEEKKQEPAAPMLDQLSQMQMGGQMMGMMPPAQASQPYQNIYCELVQWDSLVIEPVKTWSDVNWVAFILSLSREDYKKHFPGMPLSEAAKDVNGKTTIGDTFSGDDQYQVYEVWDKSTKDVFWIGKGVDTPLKVLPDPLKLKNFFPIPKPLYSIQTSHTLVPIPEYCIYQSQAGEINDISYRIQDLIRCAKFIGVYDAMQKGMDDILGARDSQFIPVQSGLMQKGGMKSIIDFLDITPVAMVLAQLYKEREEAKQVIYDVTGISDIIRGQTQASETATAQNIKASYAGLRLRDRQDNINRFFRDLLQMKAELICEFCPIEQISEVSGTQIAPEMEAIIRDDMVRSYRIDIETDSLVAADSGAEAQQRAQIVSAITQFFTAMSPLVAQGIIPLDTAKALLTYALLPTKITRELQDAIDMIGQPQAPLGIHSQMQPGMMGMQGAQGMPPQGAPQGAPAQQSPVNQPPSGMQAPAI
jgi:hypothetical protein